MLFGKFLKTLCSFIVYIMWTVKFYVCVLFILWNPLTVNVFFLNHFSSVCVSTHWAKSACVPSQCIELNEHVLIIRLTQPHSVQYPKKQKERIMPKIQPAAQNEMLLIWFPHTQIHMNSIKRTNERTITNEINKTNTC